MVYHTIMLCMFLFLSQERLKCVRVCRTASSYLTGDGPFVDENPLHISNTLNRIPVII